MAALVAAIHFPETDQIDRGLWKMDHRTSPVMTKIKMPSGLAPLSRLDVEPHFTGGAHAHQKFLQRIGAFVAWIEPLLQAVNGARLVEGVKHVFFVDHGPTIFVEKSHPHLRMG
ncbi:MAG: hypothetical protein JSR55_12295 [Proteobacteria bacterium]|nr:hypothetical protein [Pseudomonadota bacterium]